MSKTCIIVEGELEVIVLNKILQKLGKTSSIVKMQSDDAVLTTPTKLEAVLKDIQTFVDTGDYTKIAIIRDIDNHTIPAREASINLAIKNAFGLSNLPTLRENVIQAVSVPASNSRLPSMLVEFVCHFVGITNPVGNKIGEMDNLLRAIKSPSAVSAVADCVDSCLPSCLSTSGKVLKNLPKSLSKLWLYNFQRFDMGDADETFFNPIVSKATKTRVLDRDFNLMFDLNASVPELQDLIKCVDSIAQ